MLLICYFQKAWPAIYIPRPYDRIVRLCWIHGIHPLDEIVLFLDRMVNDLFKAVQRYDVTSSTVTKETTVTVLKDTSVTVIIPEGARHSTSADYVTSARL